MRIGQVSHRFRPSVGGIENYAYRLSRDLHARGHEVVVFTTTPADPVLGNQFRHEHIPSLIRSGRNPFPLEIQRRTHEASLDLIHFHSPWYFTSIIPLLKPFEIPVIMTVHGALPEPDSPSFVLATGLLGRLAKSTLRKSVAIIALSEREARRVELKFGIPHNRIRIIPNGIDIHQCETSPTLDPSLSSQRSDNILFVGRGSIDSRLNLILKSFEEVVSDFPRSRLILVGPRTKTLSGIPGTKRRVVSDSRIVALGTIPDGRLCNIYNSCGIFVSMGSWEGLPTRVLEAMFHQCVPVVARAGSLPDVVSDGEDGIVLRGATAADLSIHLRTLLSSPRRQREMGSIARKTVLSNYDWRDCFTKIMALYEDLAS